MTLPDMRFRLAATDADAQRALERARVSVRGLGTDGRRASTELQSFSRATAATGRTSNAFQYQVQNAAFQMGDFAVQVGGGTSAIRAMSQQLPQLLGGFGVIGAVAGAAAAVIGGLAMVMFQGGDAAEDMADGLNDLSPSLSGIRGSISGLQQLQEGLNTAMRAAAGASSASASSVVANSQAEYNARRQVLQIEMEILRIRQGELRSHLTNLQDQQRVAAQNAMERLQTLGAGSTASRGEGSGGYAGGGLRYDEIAQGAGIDSLMGERRRAIQRLEAELELLGIAAAEASAALNGVFEMPGTTGGAGASAGGGGGGGERQKTPVEVAIEAQKTAIHDLAESTRSELASALGAWGGYFDNLVSLSGSKSQKLLAISKSFGAAQALVNAWQAYSEVLKDPTLPWWARIAAAANVAAAGFGAVNAIKNVSAGGGGGSASGSGGAAAASAPPRPLEATLNLTGPFAEALQGALDPLLDGLREAAGDRGYQLLTVRT